MFGRLFFSPFFSLSSAYLLDSFLRSCRWQSSSPSSSTVQSIHTHTRTLSATAKSGGGDGGNLHTSTTRAAAAAVCLLAAEEADDDADDNGVGEGRLQK